MRTFAWCTEDSNHPSLRGAERPSQQEPAEGCEGAGRVGRGWLRVPQVLRGEWGRVDRGERAQLPPGAGSRGGVGTAWRQVPPRLPHPAPPPRTRERPPGRAVPWNRSRAERASGLAADAADAGDVELSILLVLGLKRGLGGTEFSHTLPAAETQFPLCRDLRQCGPGRGEDSTPKLMVNEAESGA